MFDCLPLCIRKITLQQLFYPHFTEHRNIAYFAYMISSSEYHTNSVTSLSETKFVY